MKAFQKIALVFTAIIFLFSTTGVMLIKTICSCSGEETVAIFIEPDHECCETKFQELELKSCCAVKHIEEPAHKSCCNSIEESKSCCGETETDDHSCDTSTQEYHKLDTDYTYSSEQVSLKTEITLITSILFLTNSFDIEYVNPKSGYFTSDPPDPLSGKKRVISYHQLKIPFIA